MFLLRTLNLQRIYGSEIGSKAWANFWIVIASSASSELKSILIYWKLVWDVGPDQQGWWLGQAGLWGTGAQLCFGLSGAGADDHRDWRDFLRQGVGIPRATPQVRDSETREFPQGSNNTNIMSGREHWAFIWLTVSMTFHVDDMETLWDCVTMNESFSHSSVKSVKVLPNLLFLPVYMRKTQRKKHMREHFSLKEKKKYRHK